MEKFTILIVAIIWQVCTYVKIQIAHFKYVQWLYVSYNLMKLFQK